jgi:glyoxylase-like metal-dependent hydrolase (beta-lactamase superfamily II)
MAEWLTIGEVEILSLTDGEVSFPFKLDACFPSVTAAQWEPFRQRYPEVFEAPDTWHIHWGCHLLRSRGRTILVDTGIGPRPAQFLGGVPGTLITELKQAGVDPADVDIVFITHSHLDHIGWNLTDDRKPRFPRARYVIHQADWDAAPQLEDAVMKAGAEPYLAQTLTPLRELGALDLLSGEKALTEEVTAVPTPGHTPGHMSIVVSSRGAKALITGDTIIHPAQVTESGWWFGFDSDPQQGVATRERLLERLEAEGMTMVACHFPSPGYGRIVRLQGRRYWQGL